MLSKTFSGEAAEKLGHKKVVAEDKGREIFMAFSLGENFFSSKIERLLEIFGSCVWNIYLKWKTVSLVSYRVGDRNI